jgi:galactokinase
MIFIHCDGMVSIAKSKIIPYKMLNRPRVPGPNLAVNTVLAAELRDRFERIYRQTPSLHRAPGRVNIIGEHTDYNEGFVMPAAIQFHCCAAVAPSSDRTIEVHSLNLGETRRFQLDDPRRAGDWTDYIKGVALELERLGIRLPGARLMVTSDVPLGSGLSSSAALEVSAGMALLGTQGVSMGRDRLALACQCAENDFVGARCGVMDQFAACFGKRGHALMLDCRSLKTRLLPVPDTVRLVICNTMVKHANASGEYNVRRSECETAVRLLQERFRSLTSLRDLTPQEFGQAEMLLPDTIRKRCRHVVTENSRVLAAAAALEESDLNSLGHLMDESHASLRDDYQVSSPELDLMVELARQVPGTYGARMTGGGFGGCTVNLVAVEATDEFQRRVGATYADRTGVSPEIHISSISDGAGPWEDAA